MARDNDKLAFSSAFRYQRVHMKGTVNVTTTASFGTTATVNHNLGYTPFTRVYVNYPDLSGIRNAELQARGSDYIFEIEIDNNQLRIGSTNNIDFGDSTVVPFYYRIYAEPQ